MRILIDSGNYFSDNNNHGDRALYQIIVRRLRKLWPECEIEWITRNQSLLQDICRNVSPLLLSGDREQGLDSHLTPHPDSKRILSAVQNCNLVLATGGGYFSDCFAGHAWNILDTLAAGVRHGKPACILSCGFEPIRDAALSEKMLRVLPHLDLIACREPLQSAAVVRSFGVSRHRVASAGDDAIELAFEARPSTLGNGLGINLRQASYSGVDAGAIARIRKTLQEVTEKLASPLIAVPISMAGPSDLDAIATLFPARSLGMDSDVSLHTPEDIIRQAGRCRLVVTGSYHAAVFALAQGVSVVALAASPHYQAKLKGLQAHFGAACRIVMLERADTNQALTAAIDEGWREAEAARPQLLEMAQRQIKASQNAYRRLQHIANTAASEARPQVHHPGSHDIRSAQTMFSQPFPGHHALGAETDIEIFHGAAMPAISTQTANHFALSHAEMDTFRKQGFLGPFTAFQPEEMERAQRIIYDRVLPTPTPYCPFGLRVRHLDSRTVYELCNSPAIIGRMQSLFGPDLILWNSNLFDKPPAKPGRLEEYPWHQDHYNWQMEPVLNISAWLAITPATIENGCVEVIPGSHRLIIPSIRETDPGSSLRFGGVASDPAYVDDTKKVAMTLEPGQFFLFNERLLHHSNPNRSQSRRLGLAVRITVPLAKISEAFPGILISGQDKLGFNRYVNPPNCEPDDEWLASLPDGHDFNFDRSIPGMGWHLRETDGPRQFAWTGLEPQSWIDFRPLDGGDYLLRCEVLHTIAQQALDTVRIRVNGHLVNLSRQYIDKVVVLEASVPNNILQSCSDRVRVSLEVPELLRPCDLNPASEDKRSLGLGVGRIALIRAETCPANLPRE